MSVSVAQQQELLRLRAIANLDPDRGPEEAFDRIARLARDTLNFPSSLVSLVDDQRHIFKSSMPDGACFGDLTDNFCAIAALGQDVLIIEDTTLVDPYRDFAKVTQPPFIRSYWGAPLRTAAGFNVGTLAVFDVLPRAPTERDLNLLTQLAQVTIEMMELRAAATIDVLTGVHTRRMFDARADKAMRMATKTGTALSCIVLDIDHFKSINDQYGHDVGDAALIAVGGILENNVRANDVIGRIGGEEFAILLPGTEAKVAARIAERIRQNLEQAEHARIPPFTASFGVAQMDFRDSVLADVVKRADAALYEAKTAGRNRTVIATPRGPDDFAQVALAG
jgi:diguanylate cyclase (GGDEF)-like protein